MTNITPREVCATHAAQLRLMATMNDTCTNAPCEWSSEMREAANEMERLEALEAKARHLSESATADANTGSWLVSRGDMSDLRATLNPQGAT